MLWFVLYIIPPKLLFTLKPNKNSNGHSPLRVVIVFTVVILGIDVIAVDGVFTVIIIIIIVAI